MSLQNPWSLLALIPLLGAIVTLYLLRMRRRDLRVPATFLWSPQTADIRANAPFQKLRPSLLLFLQLLAMTLAIVALANPLRKTTGLNGRATVLILDASASMGATDLAPTRFDAAVARIENVIRTMDSNDRLAVISAGNVTRVVFPLTGEKAQMLAALRTMHRTDAVGDMGEALRLASALVGQRGGARIVVLSDGSFPPVKDFSPGKAELLFEPFGVSANNVGITAFEATDLPRGGSQLFAAIRNYSSDSKTVTLNFNVDGEPVDAKRLTIAPHQTVGQTSQISATAHKAVAQMVTNGDILASDDRATLYLQSAGTIRTLLVTHGNLFLERALALEPTVRLDRAAEVPDYELQNGAGDGKYDLVIFDNLPVQKVKAAAVLSFGQVGGDLPVAESQTVERPKLVGWSRTDPILRNTDFNNLLIQRARKVTLKPGGRTIARASDDTPLIVAGDNGGHRSLFVAWNLLDSDFPLQIAFPIFIGNAVAYLTGNGQVGADGGGLAVRAGQTFAVAVPDNAKTVTLNLPDKSKRTLSTASGSIVLRDLDRVGEYTLTSARRKTEIAANLLSESESDVAPRISLDLSGKSVASRGQTFVLAETWRPIVLVVLLILAAEWWVFVRRS